MTYGFDFTWHPTRGGLICIWGGGFKSEYERDANFQLALRKAGYYPPRWWQYWRWGEKTPSAWIRHSGPFEAPVSS